MPLGYTLLGAIGAIHYQTRLPSPRLHSSSFMPYFRSMMVLRLSALLAISISLQAPSVRAQEIITRINGNAVEAIFHQVTGPIEPGFADRLAAHLDQNAEGFRVRFDSPGGDLFEGLAVGYVLREREMHTEVGNSVQEG